MDEDKQRLFLNACAGIPEETVREIEWMDFGDAVCAAHDGCSFVCENIPGTPDPRTELLHPFGIKAYACHPLFSQGRVIGTLSFGTRSRLKFTDDDLALMKMVSEHVAIAIEREKAHIELERQVKERTAELEKTNRALLAEIEERKQAEIALKASESSYRDLTESIDDLFYAMDRNLRYTYWNRASEVLTGILAKDAIGKSLYEIFPEIKGTRAEQFYIKSLKKQQLERLESEFHVGEKKYVFETNAYPTENGLSVIAKDITEKKKLEVQLSRAQRMESIGTLSSVIAHDLNNVLTPILMSQQILKEKFKDEQSQKLLDILEKNSQRGADLVKQVLSFARGIEGERFLFTQITSYPKS